MKDFYAFIDDIQYGLAAHLNLAARAKRKSKAEQELAMEYFHRRETVRGYEGFVLEFIGDRKPAQRLLKQLAAVHLRSILSPGGFAPRPHTKPTRGAKRPERLSGVTSKTIQRDLEKFSPILTIDEKRGRELYVATLADRTSLDKNPRARAEAESMKRAIEQGEHKEAMAIQHLRLLEPPVARSLVAFRNLAVGCLGEILGVKAKPTQRERFLKVALSWHTDLLVALHAVCTASVALEYILGKREQRVDLVLKDAEWRMSRDDATESIAVLASLWDEGTPFATWLNRAADDGLRVGQIEAATSCWEQAFARGFKTQPLEAAWGAQSMGAVMRGLWVNTSNPFYSGRAAEWWAVAIKLANGRDEGMCMLSAWCLHQIDPAAGRNLIPDYSERLANLKVKPPLLAELMKANERRDTTK